MGLFDELRKLGKSEIAKVAKDTMNTIQKDVMNVIDQNLNGSSNQNSTTNTNSVPKTIPAEYSEFPEFEKNIQNISTKETNNYIRCTMNFKQVSEEEISSYISKINSLGFVKGSDVRYDNGNKYIIVDYDKYSKYLELVFHIKQ